MTNAQEMVEVLKEALLKNVGISQVTVDGQTVMYNREQLIKELTYWQSQAGKESGTRPLFRGVDLGSAW